MAKKGAGWPGRHDVAAILPSSAKLNMPVSAISGPIAAAVFMSMPLANQCSSVSASAPESSATVAIDAHELLADHGADLGVVAGRVGLELAAQQLAVAEQLAVRLTHLVEDVLGRRVLGRARRPTVSKCEPGPPEAVADRGQEQVLLRAEELEEVRLADAGAAGDGLGRGAVDSRSSANSVMAALTIVVAALVGGHPGGGRCHGR